jgi:uncharacterized membrane protein
VHVDFIMQIVVSYVRRQKQLIDPLALAFLEFLLYLFTIAVIVRLVRYEIFTLGVSLGFGSVAWYKDRRTLGRRPTPFSANVDLGWLLVPLSGHHADVRNCLVPV